MSISRRQLLQSLAGLPFLGVLKPSEPPVEANATPKTPKVLNGVAQHDVATVTFDDPPMIRKLTHIHMKMQGVGKGRQSGNARFTFHTPIEGEAQIHYGMYADHDSDFPLLYINGREYKAPQDGFWEFTPDPKPLFSEPPRYAEPDYYWDV